MNDQTTFGVSFANDAHLNYSVLRTITDYTGLEKGQIKKDYQKFIFNGKRGYSEVFRMLGGSGIEIEQRGSIFDGRILSDSEINSTSYNPKVLALVFEFGIFVNPSNSKLVFLKDKMKYLVDIIRSFENKTNLPTSDNNSLIDFDLFRSFVEENGITSKTIIRYIHFFENFVQ